MNTNGDNLNLQLKNLSVPIQPSQPSQQEFINNTTNVSISILYNIVITIVITILFSILIYVGFWIKELDSNKSETVLGKYKNVKCDQESVKNKYGNNKLIQVCNAEIIYTVNEIEYIKSYKF